MRYFVQAGGREHEVEIATRPDGSVAASVGGKAVALDVVAFSERELSVRIGARVLDLTIEGNAPELGVVASGTRTYVQVESERSRVAGRASGAGAAVKSRDLRAPMPGRVIKVFVSEGDEVDEDGERSEGQGRGGRREGARAAGRDRRGQRPARQLHVMPNSLIL
jgi:acetyl/propionyl-CoA carboxylase alpha subunit